MIHNQHINTLTHSLTGWLSSNKGCWRAFSSQTPVPYFRQPDWSAVQLTSIGSRAFPVSTARNWNTLPLHVTSASSLTLFKQRLILHLFCFSFPGLSPVWLLSGPCSVCCHLGHYKLFWLIDWQQTTIPLSFSAIPFDLQTPPATSWTYWSILPYHLGTSSSLTLMPVSFNASFRYC